MVAMSNVLRWLVAAVTLLFGGVCVAFAVSATLQGDVGLGLTVFLFVQGGLYVAAAALLVLERWRGLMGLLPALALVQLVYAAEVNPAAPMVAAWTGILVGGMGPTLLLAAAAAIFWRTGTSGRRSRSAIVR